MLILIYMVDIIFSTAATLALEGFYISEALKIHPWAFVCLMVSAYDRGFCLAPVRYPPMVSIIFEPIVSGKLLGHPILFTLCLCCSLVNMVIWSLPEICPKISQSFVTGVCQRPPLHGNLNVCRNFEAGAQQLCQKVCRSFAKRV